MNGKPTLLLASNSPRRRELLALGRWTFSLAVADIDETRLPGEDPGDYVLRLAKSKARASAASARPEHVVIGADTSVVIDGDVLGKPADRIEAAAMLRRLRGRSHQVYTGIAALRVSDRLLLADLCVTEVPMRAYGDDEIDAYVQSGDPLDKAGAYGIQHPGFQPVESMRGCFASVMGLPLCHLTRNLRRLEIAPGNDIPAACQSYLDYQCPVSRAILRGEQIG